MKGIIQRWESPTPKFFKVLRNIGIIIGAVGTAIITAPVSLPAIVVSISGYMVAAGGVITAVSQLTVFSEDDVDQTKQDEILP